MVYLNSTLYIDWPVMKILELIELDNLWVKWYDIKKNRTHSSLIFSFSSLIKYLQNIVNMSSTSWEYNSATRRWKQRAIVRSCPVLSGKAVVSALLFSACASHWDDRRSLFKDRNYYWRSIKSGKSGVQREQNHTDWHSFKCIFSSCSQGGGGGLLLTIQSVQTIKFRRHTTQILFRLSLWRRAPAHAHHAWHREFNTFVFSDHSYHCPPLNWLRGASLWEKASKTQECCKYLRKELIWVIHR